MFPAVCLFSISLIFSTVLMISASSWVMMWIGMELNTLMFVAFVVSGKTIQSLEGGVKYFLAQASGSIMFLLGAVSMGLDFGVVGVVMIYAGIFMKAGMAPCHVWFPQVMGSLSWFSCFVLSTWQKVGPVFVLFHSCSMGYEWILFSVSFLSAWVGAFGAFKQSQLRSLMAYSSISHMGWMVSASICSSVIGVMYFVMYVINGGLIFFLMWYFSVYSNGLSKKSFWQFSYYRVALLGLLLSLSGMPPMVGFYPKVMAIQSLMEGGMVVQSIGLVFSSVVTLYVYLSIFVNGVFIGGNNHIGFVGKISQVSVVPFIISVVFSLGLGVVAICCMEYALNYIY